MIIRVGVLEIHGVVQLCEDRDPIGPLRKRFLEVAVVADLLAEREECPIAQREAVPSLGCRRCFAYSGLPTGCTRE